MKDCGVRYRERIYFVGRGHAPRRGTTKFVQICPSVLSSAARTVEACLHPTVVFRDRPVGRGHAPAACRNYRVRTNLFVFTVRRFAAGTPSGRALRNVYHTLVVGRDDPARRVQALSFWLRAKD